MQQNTPRFSPLRRFIFPYSGEEPLTRAQGRRVIITWAITFACALLIATLPVVAVFYNNASLQKFMMLLILVFLGGVLIFALMAWFVVWTVNQSARALQQRNANLSARNTDSSGGRYGS